MTSRHVGTIVIGIIAAVILGIALLMLVLLISIVDRLGAAPRALGDITGAASSITSSAGQAIDSVAESARGRLDPTRPPRGLTATDATIDEFRRVGVGEELASADGRVLTLLSIEKRTDSTTPITAQYAVVEERLRVPTERRILGVVVSTDDEREEHILYRGQTFQAGTRFLRVNWISFDEKAVGLVRLRDVDGPIPDLAFTLG